MNRTQKQVLVAFLAMMLSPALAIADEDRAVIVIDYDDITSEQQSSDEVIIVEIDDNDNENDEENSGLSDSDDDTIILQEVQVIGQLPEEQARVPGSGEVISKEEIEQQRPLNSNEILQMVPGVTVQDEEGMGLRQNIGIRGLNPNRSRKVLMLEDGIPISLSPYGEPEMYYTPPIDRMDRIEILKGSGSILFGPQTIGGVINYITPDTPDELTIEADGQVGTYEHLSGRLLVGDSFGKVGYLISGMHQRFGGPRNLDLARSDINLKLRARPTSSQSLILKLGFYDEVSASTYLGLTTPQFETNPRFNFAENDEFVLRRYVASLTHSILLSDIALLETRVYAHNIVRNWRRQDFDRSDLGYDYERIINGRGENILGEDNPPQDGSTVFFRDSSGNRNREFIVAGVEPRLTLDWALGAIENELQTGFRFHYELAEEQRINGDHAAASSGVVANDQDRIGYALAGYALNRMSLLDRTLHLSPGVRVESLWTDQIIYRDRVVNDEGTSAPADFDPPRENSNHLLAVLPGIGVAYNVIEPLTVFAGIHRGWAPPRTKDAVSTDGNSITLEAEHSWNYELGARADWNQWISTEVVGFLLDFDNQVIAPNEAGGAVADGVINGGESRHIGTEAAVQIDPAQAAKWGFELPIMVNYTYVFSEFGEGWSGALQGQTLPYAPEHQVGARIGFEHPLGISLQLNGNYISEQFTDKVETVDASIDGLKGVMDARFILGAQASYTHQPTNLTLYLVAKNILDEQYIVSRSPRGIQPGLQRHIYGGIRWKY